MARYAGRVLKAWLDGTFDVLYDTNDAMVSGGYEQHVAWDKIRVPAATFGQRSEAAACIQRVQRGKWGRKIADTVRALWQMATRVQTPTVPQIRSGRVQYDTLRGRRNWEANLAGVDGGSSWDMFVGGGGDDIFEHEISSEYEDRSTYPSSSDSSASTMIAASQVLANRSPRHGQRQVQGGCRPQAATASLSQRRYDQLLGDSDSD